jgi:hypothetical protein
MGGGLRPPVAPDRAGRQPGHVGASLSQAWKWTRFASYLRASMSRTDRRVITAFSCPEHLASAAIDTCIGGCSCPRWKRPSLPSFGRNPQTEFVDRGGQPYSDPMVADSRRRNHGSRPASGAVAQHFLINNVTPPQRAKNGDFFVRAGLSNGSDGVNSLSLSGGAIRSYFYPEDFYQCLGASQEATPADLRIAWRMKQLEIGKNAADRGLIERAFNILAHPEIRKCYDLLLRNEDAPPLFPYAGRGSILVQGQRSSNGELFFADRILAHKPELSDRRVSLLLRQCEFLTDQIVCRDARRELEVWLDSNLVPGLNWDLTWNHWKRWLNSRIQVKATFVHTTTGQPVQSEPWVALPSRLRVTMPEDLADDIRRARAIHALLGQHANLIEKIRTEVQKQPVEHARIQGWFDQLGVSEHLEPQHVSWQPDYDADYFEQLRRRATTWFLFRNEYLFAWATLLISEIPQRGHATYVFKKPWDVSAFMIDYARATREDVRRNRNNAATRLGFVGRVVRGKSKNRWLGDLLALAGESSEEMEEHE